MNSLLSSLPTMLPVVKAWAEKQEQIILAEGSPLTECELADARRAGVKQPEEIRVMRMEKLPHPNNDELMFVAKQMGLFSSAASGLTIGHGICLPPVVWEDRQRLVHECVHVGQYERLGGIGPFLSEYLRECIDPGYPFGTLEQEAILVAKDICKTGGPADVART